MNHKTLPYFLLLSLLTCIFTLPAKASPRFFVYQGRYVKNGSPSNGSAAMEFRVTNGGNVACGASVNGTTLFWTSGSTSVYTSNGLFSYKFGYQRDGATPDASFAAIDWSAATAYAIDVCVGGTSLNPKEIIGAGAYAFYASTAGYAATAGAVSAPAASFCGALCSGQCVDERIDANNCGGCGTQCSSGQSCSGGSCSILVCLSGSLCAGACVDETTSRNNCGACGNACNGSQTCSASSCHSCANTVCTNSCVNTQTDASNCGSCSHSCGAGTCVGGSCVCADGQTRSCYDGPNGTSGVGACHAGMQTCSGGVYGSCVGEVTPAAETCNSVDDDCDGQVDNGFNLTIDTNNCGSCGSVCPGGANGSPACAAGKCGLQCNGGFSYCSNQCVSTLSDANNCGSCGTICSPASNASPTCSEGSCGITCHTGFGDCDSNPSNGCETSTQSDDNNCGSCGNHCSGGTPNCVAGTCQ